VIGEYGDALLRGGREEDEEAINVQESDVVDLLATILSSTYSGQVVTQYIITSAMKLTSRLTDANQISRIRRLLQTNQTNLDVEIQQRATEYTHLFMHDQIMKAYWRRCLRRKSVRSNACWGSAEEIDGGRQEEEPARSPSRTCS